MISGEQSKILNHTRRHAFTHFKRGTKQNSKKKKNLPMCSILPLVSLSISLRCLLIHLCTCMINLLYSIWRFLIRARPQKNNNKFLNFYNISDCGTLAVCRVGSLGSWTHCFRILFSVASYVIFYVLLLDVFFCCSPCLACFSRPAHIRRRRSEMIKIHVFWIHCFFI